MSVSDCKKFLTQIKVELETTLAKVDALLTGAKGHVEKMPESFSEDKENFLAPWIWRKQKSSNPAQLLENRGVRLREVD